MTNADRIFSLLEFLYGEETAPSIFKSIMERVDQYASRITANYERLEVPALSERDAILITYGDQFQVANQPPLRTLGRFLESYLSDCISGVHILPFFPYSSDDGFSVIDYRQVDPDMGSWSDIHQLGRSFRLMFDAVVNHVSRQSAWFQRFVEGDSQAQTNFIVVPPETDLSQVVRPRTLPLLTPVETARGVVHVWTTFSSDQIDLNYADPQVLVEMVDLLLFYAEQGASLIRLDAIAYLWKEPGTACIHLPQTHAVVKLFRAVLDAAAPGVLLITETNVPHAENISYFGEPLPGEARTDEAQMVYAFPLAPLVLHTFQTGNARALSSWVDSLGLLPPGGTFFNFLASHDGIGVRPAEGLLTSTQIQDLVEKTLAHGGEVSYKTNPDGTLSPYELNITWYDALNDPSRPQPEIDARRFLASQAIMLCLAGVPGIYAHSLLGARNCSGCYKATGRARSLNREKFPLGLLEARLADPHSHHSLVFSGYQRMLRVRRAQPAFHPLGNQRVLYAEDGVFALLRTSPDQAEQVVCLIEAAGSPHSVRIDLESSGLPGGEWEELLSGQSFSTIGGSLEAALPPYGCLWLKPKGST